MTPHAPPVQDGRDVPGIRDIARGRGPLDAADETADRRLDDFADLLAGEQSVERVGDEVARGSWSRLAHTELVVDPTPIANYAVGIHYKNFGRPLCAALIGDDVARILEDREVDVVLAGVMRDFHERVLLVRVNADERHSLRLIPGRQFGEP